MTRLPVICSRSTRFTVSSRSCIVRNSGRSRRTISAHGDAEHRHDAPAARADSGTSRPSAMTMPPTHMIGADDHQRERHQREHLHLLHVVGRPGDQRRRPEVADLTRGERLHPVEDGRPDVPAERRGRTGAVVDGADVADDLHQRDADHQGAEAQDVARVPLHDTVVDDVGVQGGQIEGGAVCRSCSSTSRAMGFRYGPEVGPQQSYQHASLSVGQEVTRVTDGWSAPIFGHSAPRYLNRLSQERSTSSDALEPKRGLGTGRSSHGGPSADRLRPERPRMGLLPHRHVLLPHRLPHRQLLARLQDLRGRALPDRRGVRRRGCPARRRAPRRPAGPRRSPRSRRAAARRPASRTARAPPPARRAARPPHPAGRPAAPRRPRPRSTSSASASPHSMPSNAARARCSGFIDSRRSPASVPAVCGRFGVRSPSRYGSSTSPCAPGVDFIASSDSPSRSGSPAARRCRAAPVRH